MGTAIVTHAKNRISYNIIRSLAQKKVKVYAADTGRPAMSFASRYSAGHFIYPSPFNKPYDFIDCLLKNVKRLKADVLVPVLEEGFMVAQHARVLEPHVKLVLPEYNQIIHLHSKDEWPPVAARLGITVPHTHPAADLRKDIAACMMLRYPVLLKPHQGGGGWAIRQFDRADKLYYLLLQPSYYGKEWEHFSIQEKITGPTQCVAMLFCKGAYRAKVTYQQLREYPVDGGQATLRISVKNNRAEEMLQKLLEHYRFHGVCQADFVIEESSGTPYLVDVNPRFWGSLAQALACGVDFPYMLYRIAMEGDVPPQYEFTPGVVTRWLGGDLRAFCALLRRSHAKFEFIKEFVASSRPATYYDDISWDDPLPLLTWFIDKFAGSLKSHFTGSSDIEAFADVWRLSN